MVLHVTQGWTDADGANALVIDTGTNVVTNSDTLENRRPGQAQELAFAG